jgi:hypothetical protein
MDNPSGFFGFYRQIRCILIIQREQDVLILPLSEALLKKNMQDLHVFQHEFPDIH